MLILIYEKNVTILIITTCSFMVTIINKRKNIRIQNGENLLRTTVNS